MNKAELLNLIGTTAKKSKDIDFRRYLQKGRKGFKRISFPGYNRYAAE